MLLRFILPKDRRVLLVKPGQAAEYKRVGYVPAPWDCICERRCRCHERPVTPPPGRLDEARATLARLQAGIAAAEARESGIEPALQLEPAAEPRVVPAPRRKVR